MSEMYHFQLMSKYNIRMNKQVYEAALNLDDELLKKDLGSFFHSINGTLNHILVGDLLWFSRFTAHSKKYESLVKIASVAQPKSLNEILFEKVSDLYKIRKEVDSLIDLWVNTELEEVDLGKALMYKNSKGAQNHKPFGELLSHVFNHQTHHRGQVSTLLSQNGVDVGITDFLIDIPNVA
ncbi:DinB family protein [Saccharophagus degradans]|uniref:DinB family protein n=1 Tax=Saccharophagus degradans TaxID=86304 RepID=A0AAW7X242_9GAMM|nr:DinB family protein [Saccharophagus degradans]MDO6421540.1 DinB family protein [Saccharophagus degradans]MDO6608646.1 DinB family protein [Saccharophagus degradans]